MSKMIEEKEKLDPKTAFPFTCVLCRKLWAREARVCEECGYRIKRKLPSPVIRLHIAR